MFSFFNRNNGKSVNVNDIDNLIGKVELIDIREPYEYSRGTIKTSKNISMQTLLSNPDKYLKKGKEYYIICQSGGRSSRVCSELSKNGFDVTNVVGGVGAYLGKHRSW
ncbi:rhodanese-like domain-containing protein [Clostridium sp. D53t1_180928_C8]|uniref:rhodanese-like domain-containing protein n=1 Tax=Clostridium sp. D53t1_180928_C8 TaxID=2787101 RepID=UPI0018AA0BC6|nr:rhodanese-like domain-containing protein [Clostridium sp. D53t1_180928_C8]